VHAAVLDAQGRAIAPVTVMGTADQVEIASSGALVDIWLKHDRTITWARARCAAPR
jgi:hypothetical protein